MEAYLFTGTGYPPLPCSITAGETKPTPTAVSTRLKLYLYITKSTSVKYIPGGAKKNVSNFESLYPRFQCTELNEIFTTY